MYFVARSPTSGRMRYAPTVFGEIFGGRAITVKGTFYRKFFMPRRTGTFCLQKISARRTGSFWCYNLHRLVVPVVFGVAICISSSYRYFLMLQIAMARRTGSLYRYFTLLNRSGSFEYAKRHINTFISDLASTDAVEDKKIM